MNLQILYVMDDDIIERRIQFRGGCFVLTIPRKIVLELGISKGQSARFTVDDGQFIVRPTRIDTPKMGSGKATKYARAVERMMDDTRKENEDVHPKISRLEKLRIK